MTAFQASLDLDLVGVPETPETGGIITSDGNPPAQGPAREPRGVVYTKGWVVDLILDLVGYKPSADLAMLRIVEPSAGEGAFLVPIVRRLLASLKHHGRELHDAKTSIQAYELDADTASHAIKLARQELVKHGATPQDAQQLAETWIKVGDYLLQSPKDQRADFIVGNPPYIRYDDVPGEALEAYQGMYRTMTGRVDIYVGFLEAALRQLVEGGVIGFICADRWMRSSYGAELRRLISSGFAVETVIEMHDAPAFENDVAAYPAVVVIRRSRQRQVLLASAGQTAGSLPADFGLADALASLAGGQIAAVPGFTAMTMSQWFTGTSPWPSLEPGKLAMLQQLEARFAPLEDKLTGTKLSIGIATGADRVFITTDPSVVEPDRLVPLAMTADTRSGTMQWSGHYLINPWAGRKALVDLAAYPKLEAYFQQRKKELTRRYIAERNPSDWYRTIDPMHHELTGRPKLYFPDMKLNSNPVLDLGETYPHHNLYYLTSTAWDLEVLGGLLLSRVAQLFIEAYCVRMRGGTLRFQAQYLRRIRVPDPEALSQVICDRLREAFRTRDVEAATSAAIEAYGVADLATVVSC
jgi:adenine-specific DNA-methyltransferase